MSKLEDALVELTDQVARNTQVEASAIELIKGLADQIGQSADDPEQVKELSARLKSSADALSAAVIANTVTEATPEAATSDEVVSGTSDQPEPDPTSFPG